MSEFTFSDEFRPAEPEAIKPKFKPKVYAFDVDECMETSNGPVTVQMLKDLRKEGHIIGICGALCRFLQKVPDWHEVISFTLNFDFGYEQWYAGYGLRSLIPKEVWMHCFQHVTYPDAAEYIMVGNIAGQKNSPCTLR